MTYHPNLAVRDQLRDMRRLAQENGSHDHRSGQIIARFSARCAGSESVAIPAEVIRRAKLILMDTLGNILSASRQSSRSTQFLSRFVADSGDGRRYGVVAPMFGYRGYGLDIESHHSDAECPPRLNLC